MTVVWDKEALIDSYKHIKVDDHDLNREVENIEACFVLVIGWVGPWPIPTCIIDSGAERCTCAEKNSSHEEDRYLMPEPPAAKFLNAGRARYDETADDEQDREEGYDGVEGLTVELNVVVDAFCIQVECIIALDDGGNKGNQTDDDDDVDAHEGKVEEGMPAGVGMRGPNYALGKEEIDDQE